MPEALNPCSRCNGSGTEPAQPGMDQIRAYEDLLGAIWLYIPWRYVTKQLTTPQKELFADAVEACSARMNAIDPDIDSNPAATADRWWRDDA